MGLSGALFLKFAALRDRREYGEAVALDTAMALAALLDIIRADNDDALRHCSHLAHQLARELRCGIELRKRNAQQEAE